MHTHDKSVRQAGPEKLITTDSFFGAGLVNGRCESSSGRGADTSSLRIESATRGVEVIRLGADSAAEWFLATETRKTNADGSFDHSAAAMGFLRDDAAILQFESAESVPGDLPPRRSACRCCLTLGS